MCIVNAAAVRRAFWVPSHPLPAVRLRRKSLKNQPINPFDACAEKKFLRAAPFVLKPLSEKGN